MLLQGISILQTRIGMKKMRISIGIYKVINRFDERIKTFIKEEGQLKVKKIDSDEVGGLKVTLSGGFKLEVFPDSSEDDEQSEHWRFFNRKKTVLILLLLEMELK